MEITADIEKRISENPILLFMKGSPDAPQCGFSMQVARALQACQAKFAYVDVLSEPEMRRHLPSYSNWPTFPQLFVNGELIGGCDIVVDLFQQGRLQEIVRAATRPATEAAN